MPQADNMLFRTELIKTWDDKEQQQLELFGRDKERLGGTTGKNAVPRVQEYGFSGNAPVGSLGMAMAIGGNPDNAMVIGMEHAQYRPKNLAEGEVKVYDKWGHFLYEQQAQWYFKVGPCEVWLKDGGAEIKLKVGGAIIDMLSAGGVVHLNP